MLKKTSAMAGVCDKILHKRGSARFYMALHKQKCFRRRVELRNCSVNVKVVRLWATWTTLFKNTETLASRQCGRNESVQLRVAHALADGPWSTVKMTLFWSVSRLRAGRDSAFDNTKLRADRDNAKPGGTVLCITRVSSKRLT